MNRVNRPAGLALAATLALARAPLAGEAVSHGHGATHHWSYEGPEGPEHWGDLDPSFATCKSGHHQSPINIPATTIKGESLPPIHFDYKLTPLHVTDNGHTVMVTWAPGSTIRVGSAVYELQQVHFHHPSEERIDGKSFPMDAHFVHKDKDGKLAVVAILFQDGAANPTLAVVFGHLPSRQGSDEAPRGVDVNAALMLPSKASYFTFEGSLTTPPCTEGVTWFVLRQPVTASAEQLAAFARRYPSDARPVQPLNGRTIHAMD